MKATQEMANTYKNLSQVSVISGWYLSQGQSFMESI
jgi:hypothetical protein